MKEDGGVFAKFEKEMIKSKEYLAHHPIFNAVAYFRQRKEGLNIKHYQW